MMGNMIHSKNLPPVEERGKMWYYCACVNRISLRKKSSSLVTRTSASLTIFST